MANLTLYDSKMFIFQSRLAKYGFAARYKGPIGMKGKEHSPTSFHEQEFSADSGEITCIKNTECCNLNGLRLTVYNLGIGSARLVK